MAKKIYDILPPKLVNRSENTTKHSGAGKKKESHHQKTHRSQKERRFPLKEILFGGLVIIFLIGIYFYNKLPKADIQVWPKIDNLILQEKITADKNVDHIDLSQKVIPAQYIEQTEDAWQEFQSSGVVPNGSKASGTIKVYNKISPSTSFALKTGTHFLSDSGKYFVTLNKITIPGAKGRAPGSVEVKVQAEQPGEDYNIEASKFSAPKLSGTAYYYNIWAESNTAMVGGYTGNLKKVTKDDISQAKEVLTKKLLIQAESSLKSRLSSDDILLDGAISRDVISASPDVKTDSTVDKFNESAKVKVSAIVFKKQDLEKIARDDVLSQLPETKNILEKSLDMNYSPELIDMQNGKETLNLQLSAKTYNSMDTGNLIDLISRKSSSEIYEIFNEKCGDKISDIKINFWPFWVNKTPKDKNRIKINLNFE